MAQNPKKIVLLFAYNSKTYTFAVQEERITTLKDKMIINTILFHNYETYKNKHFAIKDINMKDKYQFGKVNLAPSFNYSRYFNLYKYNDTVYCNVNFQDYIYELGADSVKAKYRLEYGPENISHHQYSTKEEYYALQELYPYYNGEFVELKDYTYIRFRGEDGLELIYDHKSKQTFAMSSGFNRPMTAFFRLPIARIGDNTMVCPLTASELILVRGALKEDEDLKRLYSNLSIDSNPVLFFYDVELNK